MDALIAAYPSYAENFYPWSEQAAGILAGNVWTALALEGLGASLQHYNALIEEAVREEWKVPATWKVSFL